MARIIHLSDLHFGTVRPELVEPLLQLVEGLMPRVVVVSGDLTQRARHEQFAAAANLLKEISAPKVVVPGNHDISWNPYRRFVRPLSRYSRHLGAEIEPTYQDDELLVVGVNTARSLTWKEGRLSREQIERLEARLQAAPEDVFKAVVMHHPFLPPEALPHLPVVGRARDALRVLERCGADVVLAGHYHRGFSRQTPLYYRSTTRSILVVQAGTALSHRTRHEANSFNMLDIEPGAVELHHFEWDANERAFVARPMLRFVDRGIWKLVNVAGSDLP